MDLESQKQIYIKQIFEPMEFMGFETRNKYAIYDSNKQQMGYAAEQQKNFLGSVMRQVLKHWRSFDVYVFDTSRKKILHLSHPFRFFFRRFEVKTINGEELGYVVRKFSYLRRKFDICNKQGKCLMQIRPSLFQIWTYPVLKNLKPVAKINKKFGKIFNEIFTDKDSFQLEFISKSLSSNEKTLLLSAVLLIDLIYFENNKSSLTSIIPDIN